MGFGWDRQKVTVLIFCQFVLGLGNNELGLDINIKEISV